MIKSIWMTGGAMLLVLLLGSGGMAQEAELYPGVYAGEDALVFIQSCDDSATFHGIVILSYEYSMDWILTVASTGVRTDAGLLMTDGHQYTYGADGTRLSETQFTSLDRAVPWEAMEFQVLPSYGFYLAPMVRGGLAYALVENKSGLPAQLVLAKEAIDTGDKVNLFEGFLYQISDGVLTAQIAFTEIAFGSQGLVRGRFPEDFPPPPEDYPIPYPAYTEPGYPPPGDLPASGTSGSPGTGTYIDPTLPQGTPVPPEEVIEHPHFTLEPMHDYDIPPIVRIGVVAFQDSAEITDYDGVCDQFLQDALSGIEGIELVFIPFDDTLLGGAVMYDRAVWICDQYDVDAIIMSNLDEFEIAGGEEAVHYSRTVRTNVNIDSQLLEGTGGSEFWGGEFEGSEMHEAYQLESDRDLVLRNDLHSVINNMVSDLIASGALDGGHVD